jgi:hypothetical protein
MQDNDLLRHWRAHYDAPDADNSTILAQTEALFIKQPWEQRKGFVDGLETAMLDYEIGIKERAERLSLHRRFRALHEGLKRVGR